MKKKNTLLAVALLIGVLALGIGYAITASNLTINGTATAKDTASNFSVVFDTTVTPTGTADTKSYTNNTTATMSVELTNVGDSKNAVFTVKNASTSNINAIVEATDISASFVDHSGGLTAAQAADYFTVTPTCTAAVLAPGETTTCTVTVTLRQVSISGDQTGEFTVTISGIEGVAATPSA